MKFLIWILNKLTIKIFSWILVFWLVIKLFDTNPMIATILTLLVLGSKFKF